MNIYTIAQLAGVSKSTVSRVLSKNGSVSKKSYDKVMKIIEEYDYKPNQYAQILNRKSTNLIGIITPDIANPYFPEIIKYISDLASSYGYRVILCQCDSDSKSENDYLAMLSDMYVDGAILLCPTSEVKDSSYLHQIPIVTIDSVINKEIPYVCSDFYKGGFLAATKLVDNGCKNLLHISGNLKYYANMQRKQGFEAAIAQHTESIASNHLLSNMSYNRSYLEIRTFLENNPHIDGIFAGNDSLAFLILRILHELEIPVPQNIKLIGYDDNFMIPMVYPLLSTIHQPIEDVAKTATTTLISLIRNQQVQRENILDVTYIKRNTTSI